MTASEQLFYITSLKHTSKQDEHITWWSTNHCGYTPVLGERCGKYTLDEARQLNDGYNTLAVPVDAVAAVMSDEPYYRMSHHPDTHRFYDQRGPVVLNTRANWNRLVAASLPDGRHSKPKPEVFRGKRRSFALADQPVAA